MSMMASRTVGGNRKGLLAMMPLGDFRFERSFFSQLEKMYQMLYCLFNEFRKNLERILDCSDELS